MLGDKNQYNFDNITMYSASHCLWWVGFGRHAVKSVILEYGNKLGYSGVRTLQTGVLQSQGALSMHQVQF